MSINQHKIITETRHASSDIKRRFDCDYTIIITTTGIMYYTVSVRDAMDVWPPQRDTQRKNTFVERYFA